MLPTFHETLYVIQHSISFAGILIILSGVVIALVQYLRYFIVNTPSIAATGIDIIRSNLGRVLILGLEFIVAADLIGTMTTPDYYSVGIVACIVAIRTVLSYTINREITNLHKEDI